MWTGVLLTIPFGLWIAWRARQPEFTFLAGQKPFVGEFVVPANAGFAGPPFYETVYSFKADPTRIIRMADDQLVRAGWTKTVSQDWVTDGDSVGYREPGPYGRDIWIEPNVQVPTYAVTTDIITGGIPSKGWVGIVISQQKNPPADWRTRAAQWLNHVFLGKP